MMKGSLNVTGLEKSCSVPRTPARNPNLAGWKAYISQTGAATKRKFITFRGEFFKLEVHATAGQFEFCLIVSRSTKFSSQKTLGDEEGKLTRTKFGR